MYHFKHFSVFSSLAGSYINTLVQPSVSNIFFHLPKLEFHTHETLTPHFFSQTWATTILFSVFINWTIPGTFT